MIDGTKPLADLSPEDDAILRQLVARYGAEQLLAAQELQLYRARFGLCHRCGAAKHIAGDSCRNALLERRFRDATSIFATARHSFTCTCGHPAKVHEGEYYQVADGRCIRVGCSCTRYVDAGALKGPLATP